MLHINVMGRSLAWQNVCYIADLNPRGTKEMHSFLLRSGSDNSISLYLHRLSIFYINCTENGECVMTA